MKLRSALLILATLVATPVLAGAPVIKRPVCLPVKAGPRDVKRVETCRRPQAIPSVIDPTPVFLASTAASPALLSDLS